VKSRCKSFVIAMLVTLAAPTLRAQTSEPDPPQRPLFTWRDAVLGGGFVLGTIAIRPLDKQAADLSQRPFPQNNRALRRAATTFNRIALPGSFVIGGTLYAAGRLSSNERMAALGLHGTEALFVGGVVGSVLKGTFGRARPFVDSVPNPDNWQLLRGFGGDGRYHSFPSGHTAAGFAAAAAVTAETSRWWPSSIWYVGPAMYGGAALVGLSRMYDNRHWASDVIMGAAIGTFAGIKVVRYHRTNPGNRIDEWLLNASLTPGDWSRVSLSLVPLNRGRAPRTTQR
jgi:membrane-associated phospholipid phosphatase